MGLQAYFMKFKLWERWISVKCRNCVPLRQMALYPPDKSSYECATSPVRTYTISYDVVRFRIAVIGLSFY